LKTSRNGWDGPVRSRPCRHSAVAGHYWQPDRAASLSQDNLANKILTYRRRHFSGLPPIRGVVHSDHAREREPEQEPEEEQEEETERQGSDALEFAEPPPEIKLRRRAVIQRRTASELIDDNTTLGFLDEEDLGSDLAREIPSNGSVAIDVMNQLDSWNTDDVAYEPPLRWAHLSAAPEDVRIRFIRELTTASSVMTKRGRFPISGTVLEPACPMWPKGTGTTGKSRSGKATSWSSI
jgi:hypothetical protein